MRIRTVLAWFGALAVAGLVACSEGQPPPLRRLEGARDVVSIAVPEQGVFTFVSLFPANAIRVVNEANGQLLREQRLPQLPLSLAVGAGPTHLAAIGTTLLATTLLEPSLVALNAALVKTRSGNAVSIARARLPVAPAALVAARTSAFVSLPEESVVMEFKVVDAGNVTLGDTLPLPFAPGLLATVAHPASSAADQPANNPGPLLREVWVSGFNQARAQRLDGTGAITLTSVPRAIAAMGDTFAALQDDGVTLDLWNTDTLEKRARIELPEPCRYLATQFLSGLSVQHVLPNETTSTLVALDAVIWASGLDGRIFLVRVPDGSSTTAPYLVRRTAELPYALDFRPQLDLNEVLGPPGRIRSEGRALYVVLEAGVVVKLDPPTAAAGVGVQFYR